MITRACGAALVAWAFVRALVFSPVLVVAAAAQLSAEDTLGIDPAEGL